MSPLSSLLITYFPAAVVKCKGQGHIKVVLIAQSLHAVFVEVELLFSKNHVTSPKRLLTDFVFFLLRDTLCWREES